MSDSYWKRCSSCKRELGFETQYWKCSVSTCNRKGNAFVFCSVTCFEIHVPTLRHRESWAEEDRSPSRAALQSATEPRRIVVRDSAPASAPAGDVPRDVLIVASKLKAYVRARSGMNTSESVLNALSKAVRGLCDDAILRAREDGRKTLMDRDF